MTWARTFTKKASGNSPHSLVTVTASLGRQEVSLKLDALGCRQSASYIGVDEIVFDLKQAIEVPIALKIRLLDSVLFRLRHTIAKEVSA
jgi:hypothetical protein